MVVQQQQTTGKNRSSFSRPNPCIGCSKNSNNGHRATRDFSPLFYTRYSKREHTAQLCHNLVTTLSQGCHKVVTVQLQSCHKGCHKAIVAILWQPCDYLVISVWDRLISYENALLSFGSSINLTFREKVSVHWGN